MKEERGCFKRVGLFQACICSCQRVGDGSPQLEAMDKNLVNTRVGTDGLRKDSGVVCGAWSTGNRRAGTREFVGGSLVV